VKRDRAAPRGEFVAVDWGTTHLRLRLLDGSRPHSPPLAEIASAEGIGELRSGEHEAIFLRNLDGLLEAAGHAGQKRGGGEARGDWTRAGGEVYFAGMITSTLGWFETPYVRAPAGPRELLAGRREESACGVRLHFLPGVRTGEDVLRGEEVEAIGILGVSAEHEPCTLVLPGTHSKWILWEDGKIEDFTTVPTGDLHAALHRATLLARTLPEEPAAIDGALEEQFLRGVDAAGRVGPLSALFKVRALPVLTGLAKEEASAFLSGVLIGGEIAERTRSGAPKSLLVAGAPRLRELYLTALARLGVVAEGVPAERAEMASAEGLRAIRGMARGSGGS